MTSPDLNLAGKQVLGKHRPPKDYFVQHCAAWCCNRILLIFYVIPINLRSLFSAPLSPTWKLPPQHNAAETPARNSSANTCPLAMVWLTGSVEKKKKEKVFLLQPKWPRADIREGFWFKMVRIKKVQILINDPLRFFISHKAEKKWHRLNFYNVLFSSVRRKFSSLGAKLRKIISLFRQLNKRLNFQWHQYPVFLIATRRDWNLTLLLKRCFPTPKRKLFYLQSISTENVHQGVRDRSPLKKNISVFYF